MSPESVSPRRPRVHVFSGPTLDPAEVRRLRPDAVAHGPVKHGDLFDPEIGEGDAVLIVDGLFHQSRALRHKEILHLLHRGAGVYGCSSIGALRAVELRDHGMVGLGRIYRQYARGEIEGDDEVAVAQSPSGNWQARSIPMVNVREMLRRALREGVVTAPQARGYVSLFRAIYYPQRTLAAMREAAGPAGGAAFAGWLAGRVGRDPHFCNLKRADAVRAIRVIGRAGGPRPAPPRVPSDREWRTGFYRDWVNHFARDAKAPDLPVRLRVHYRQIFDPGFGAVWADYLRRLSESPADGSAPMPLTERMRRFRPDGSGPGAADVFRPRLDLGRPGSLGLLLGNETEDDRARIRSFLAENAAFAARRPGLSHHLMRGAVAARLLGDLWRVREEELPREAASRGFRTTEEALEAFRTFALGHCARVRAAGARAPVPGAAG